MTTTPNVPWQPPNSILMNVDDPKLWSNRRKMSDQSNNSHRPQSDDERGPTHSKGEKRGWALRPKPEGWINKNLTDKYSYPKAGWLKNHKAQSTEYKSKLTILYFMAVIVGIYQNLQNLLNIIFSSNNGQNIFNKPYFKPNIQLFGRG